MLQAVKWLSGGKRRCWVCLFELDPKAKPLRLDVDHDWHSIFYTSDSHEFRFKDLNKSARRGCETCTRIITSLRQCDVSFITARWWPSRGKWGPRPRLELSDPSNQFELCIVSNLIQDGDSPVHPCISRGNKVTGHTSDAKALDEAVSWLTKCRSEHKQCQMKDSEFAPTRLLFIGGDDPGTIRLVENPSSSTSYAALSHRWSDETQVVRLEESNLHHHKLEGIPLSKFPQMMRDIIVVLRRFRIRYVWIDCLCIIQGDTEDWRREAARMASIYTNAELTIAATWCNGSGQSLFSDRGGNEYSSVDVKQVGDQSVFLRRTLPHFSWRNFETGPLEGDAFFNPESEWPLLARGWVYQEQLLSRRMLHFTRQELLWECNETTGCECGRYVFDDAEGSTPSERGYKLAVTSKAWSQIIQEYSIRDFTFPSDKLPALAGVARAFVESDEGGIPLRALDQGTRAHLLLATD